VCRPSISSLEYGTPLYVYSRHGILERYRAFTEAFAALDPLIAYSVKANGNLAVLRCSALPAPAPTSSAAASCTAPDCRHAGRAHPLQRRRQDRNRNGGCARGRHLRVQRGERRRAAHARGTRCRHEDGRARGVAREPDVETRTPHHYTATGHKATKFGIPYEDAEQLYHTAASLPGIRVRGIDVHIGSQIVDVEPYCLAVSRVLELVERLQADGIELEFIDVGGGFGVSYDEGDDPEPADFAAGLVPLLADRGLRVVFEPGRYIVGPAGVLLTRVLYVKKMSGKVFVITDAGMNDLLRPSHYSSYHRVDPAVRQGRELGAR
jgi:diaminopimelate decarboxylase